MAKQSLRQIALRLALLGFLPAVAFSAPAAAQGGSGQQESVADAARRARAQKQTPQKPAKVITTDDLSPKPAALAGTVTAPAQAAAATATPAETPAASEAPAPAVNTEEQESTSAELADLKKQLQETMKELDLQKRDYDLQHDQVYQNPDSSANKAGKEALDALQHEVDDKEHTVESLKSRIAAVQELLKSVGVKVETPAPVQPGAEPPPADSNTATKP